MTIRKRYRVMRRTFDTLDAALAYASLIFERTGVLVETREIRSVKGGDTAMANTTAIERWREPDIESNTPLGYYAIWYGPEGAAGEYATMIEHTGPGRFRVSEYQDVTAYLDEPPPARFNVQSVEFDFDAAGPDDARAAVAYGVQLIQEQGGSEDWADELPC